MNKPLTGKVALVTGGSRGIGAACALALADLGAAVAISYAASGEKAAAIASQIERRGVRAGAFRADQADRAEVAGLVADVHASFGRLDILVANAGVFEAASIDADVTVALDRMYAVNVVGVIASIRAAARVMAEDGRIIAMSSTSAMRVGAPGLADYSASKSAIAGYVRGAARDLGPRRITVNALGIGPVATDMNPDSGPFADWLKSATALRRYAPAGGDRRRGRLPGFPDGELHHGVDLGRRWRHRRMTRPMRADDQVCLPSAMTKPIGEERPPYLVAPRPGNIRIGSSARGAMRTDTRPA